MSVSTTLVRGTTVEAGRRRVSTKLGCMLVLQLYYLLVSAVACRRLVQGLSKDQGPLAVSCMPRARRAVGLASCLQISYLQLQLYRKYYSVSGYQRTVRTAVYYLCVLRFVTVVGHRVASAHILIAQQLQLLHKRLPCV